MSTNGASVNGGPKKMLPVARDLHNRKIMFRAIDCGVPVLLLNGKAPIVQAYPALDVTFSDAERDQIAAEFKRENGFDCLHVGSTLTRETVLAWWNGSSREAAATGISPGLIGAICIDCDDEGGRLFLAFLRMNGIEIEFSVTPVTMTPSGGRHFWFANPDRVGCGKNRELNLDFKGVGGQLVAPNTVLPAKEKGGADRRYVAMPGSPDLFEAVKAGALPALPDCVRDLKRSAPRGTASDPDVEVHAAIAALKAGPPSDRVDHDVMAMVDRLRDESPYFDELWRDPSADTSTNRFKFVREMLRQYGEDAFDIHDYKAVLEEWDGGGVFTDHPTEKGEYNARGVARAWVKNAVEFRVIDVEVEALREPPLVFADVVAADMIGTSQAGFTDELQSSLWLADAPSTVTGQAQILMAGVAAGRDNAMTELEKIVRAHAGFKDRHGNIIEPEVAPVEADAVEPEPQVAEPEAPAEPQAETAKPSEPQAETMKPDPKPAEPKPKSGFDPWSKILSRSLAEILATPLPVVSMLVKRLLTQAEIVVAAGTPGAGKTSALQHLCLSIAEGTPFLGRATKQGAVMYCGVENEKEDDRRIHAHAMQYAHEHNLPYYFFNRRVKLDHLSETATRSEKDIIEDAIRIRTQTGFPVRLIVIDNLRGIITPGNTNDEAHCTMITRALERIRDKTEAGVLLVHHTIRSGERFAGSGAIESGVDSVWHFGPVKKGATQLQITFPKLRLGDKAQALRYAWTLKVVTHDDDGDPIETVVTVPHGDPSVAMGATDTDPPDPNLPQSPARSQDAEDEIRKSILMEAARDLGAGADEFTMRDMQDRTDAKRKVKKLEALSPRTHSRLVAVLVEEGSLIQLYDKKKTRYALPDEA